MLNVRESGAGCVAAATYCPWRVRQRLLSFLLLVRRGQALDNLRYESTATSLEREQFCSLGSHC